MVNWYVECRGYSFSGALNITLRKKRRFFEEILDAAQEPEESGESADDAEESEDTEDDTEQDEDEDEQDASEDEDEQETED
jgi:hypothetical protein